MSLSGQAVEEAASRTYKNIGGCVVIDVGENGRCFYGTGIVFYGESERAFGLQDGVEAIEIESAFAAKEDLDKSILVEVGDNRG